MRIQGIPGHAFLFAAWKIEATFARAHVLAKHFSNTSNIQICVHLKIDLYVRIIINYHSLGSCVNESTAGADASVEVPKLHNIKLLASFYTHIDYNYHN